MNIGLVGLGFMGVTHYRAIKRIDGARVTALCEANEKRLGGDWTDVQGNIGGSGGVEDVSGINKYTRLEDFLKDPDVELVDICLPTPFHRDAAIQAMEAGKHVLVEKPIALTVADADAMVETSRRTGRKLMVAQVLRFFPEFAYLKQLVDSGERGALLGVHLKRIIARPKWSTGGWLSDPKQTGGVALDLHIHDSDFVRYLCGMPDSVQSTGVIQGEDEVTYMATLYRYDNRNVAVSAASGAVAADSAKFEQGYDAYFEKGTLRFNSIDEVPLTLFTDEGKQKVDLPDVDGWQEEITYAVRCLEAGREPEIISGASARESLYLCLKELDAVRAGAPVRL